MSQENVEQACRSVDVYNRRDIDGVVALMSPVVELESRLTPLEGPYRGHDGARRWYTDFLSVFPDYRLDVEDVRDLGELTITCGRARLESVASRIALPDRLWLVHRWEDGKATWIRFCWSEEEALTAAGE